VSGNVDRAEEKVMTVLYFDHLKRIIFVGIIKVFKEFDHHQF
jgi:hypothetical protein